MPSFTFSINASELTNVDGICSFEGEKLNLEIQTKDALVGLIKTRPKNVSFALNDIDSVKLITGWFGGFFYRKFELRLKTVALANKLPGNKINEVELKFKRKYLKTVTDLVEDINYCIGIKRLDDLDRKSLNK